jgi:S1-C subfamily serine protease
MPNHLQKAVVLVHKLIEDNCKRALRSGITRHNQIVGKAARRAREGLEFVPRLRKKQIDVVGIHIHDYISQSIAVSAFILFSFLNSSPSFAARNGEDPIEKLMPAVVAIYGPPTGGICTGSVISHNLVVTAGHCVSSLKDSVVSKKDISKPINAKVVFLSHDFDLAILRLEHSVPEPYLTIIAPNETPQAGESLNIVGHRWGKINDVRKGQFNDTRENILIIKAEARPGNSGGPILNERGQIVGVLYGMSLSGATYGVAADEIKRALISLETLSTEIKPWSPSYKHLGYRFAKNDGEIEHYLSIGIDFFYETHFVSSFDLELGIFPQISGSIGIPLQPVLRLNKPPFFLGINLIPKVEIFFDARDGQFSHRYALGLDLFQTYIEFGFAKKYQSMSFELRFPL